MRRRHGAALALLFLATCSEDPNERSSLPLEPSQKALGTVPPTEVAVWRKVGTGSTPDGRYLQAVAFDETRRVLVMFGVVGSALFLTITGHENRAARWADRSSRP